MKRNWELIRDILFAAERLESLEHVLSARDVQRFPPGYIYGVVAHHMQILGDAKLVQYGELVDGEGEPVDHIVRRLTWDGHELLTHMRTSRVWEQVEGQLRDAHVGLSLEALGILVPKVLWEILHCQ